MMKKAVTLFFSLLIVFSLQAFSNAKGYLFIIGGGRRPESMMKKFIELVRSLLILMKPLKLLENEVLLSLTLIKPKFVSCQISQSVDLTWLCTS